MAVKRAKLKDLAGTWFITAMDDMAEDYWAEEPEAPFIRLEVPRGSSGLSGEYVIGLSSGGINGDLRELGGEPVVVFSYAGEDEMDPSSGGGWLQLLDASRDTLEGEFIGPLGRFCAERKAPSQKTVKHPSRARGRTMGLR